MTFPGGNRMGPSERYTYAYIHIYSLYTRVYRCHLRIARQSVVCEGVFREHTISVCIRLGTGSSEGDPPLLNPTTSSTQNLQNPRIAVATGPAPPLMWKSTCFCRGTSRLRNRVLHPGLGVWVLSCGVYRGTSLIRDTPPPQDHNRDLGIVLL